MFRKFLRDNKGQNTAEYALLIALVVAGVIAMQTYLQRGLQARARGANNYLADNTKELGTAKQYEPYYQQSNYDVTRDSAENKRLGDGLVAQDAATKRERTGKQETTYGSVSADTNDAPMPTGI